MKPSRSGSLRSVILCMLAACGSDGDGEASEQGTCEGQADREIAACPEQASSREDTIEICDGDVARYELAGCGEAYRAWLACTSNADTWDCEEGPSGCDGQQDGYFRCQSEFVQRTGCTPGEPADERCPASAPNSFGCLAPEPPKSQCEKMDGTGGSLANLYCCP